MKEVATLTCLSETKVRALIADGIHLALDASTRTDRVTAESLYRYIRSLIADGPRLPTDIAAAEEEESFRARESEVLAPSQKRIGELEAEVRELLSNVRTLERQRTELQTENEQLRHTTLVLRQNYQALSDDHGAYSGPKFPND